MKREATTWEGDGKRKTIKSIGEREYKRREKAGVGGRERCEPREASFLS